MFGMKQKPFGWGFGMMLGGISLNNNKLGTYFKTAYSAGFNMEMYYKRVGICLDGLLNLTKLKKDIEIQQNNIWKKNSKADMFLGNLSIVYIALNGKKISIAPHLGAGILEVSAKDRDTKNNKQPENFYISKFSYVTGVIVDYKFPKVTTNNYRGTSYLLYSIRLKYSLYYPQFRSDSIYKGLTNNFSVGYSMFFKGKQREL
jgi:hypothetical protein